MILKAGGRHITCLLLVWLPGLFSACHSGNDHGATGDGGSLFTRLDAGVSGIHFSNTITENDTVNLIADEYAYMGSGVGVGDFNNDGLPDLFFGGSQVSSRLYLNLGNNRFRDITRSAGVGTSSWCTGISVVDINNDGYPDIYVCVSGNVPGSRRRNLLFINNRDLTFTESAVEYGLADTGYSTQAAFFDYDKDGRLDMYLVNHELHPAVSQNDIVKPDTGGRSIRSDKLYRNMGILPGTNHPYFKDVSLSAGIKDDGYGLGVVVSDLNGDGWPDLYVTNDYLSNDLLWINNRNGTFSNVIGESLGHQSYSSMGVDAADVNNDGLPDVATLDMMPEDNYRKKMMFSFMSYERYEAERRAGYQPEFMRNMLQLNRGVAAGGPGEGGLTGAGGARGAADPEGRGRTRGAAEGDIPYFSDIGQFAGMSQTDWSWSILLADFDNDGYKDIAITNGLGRDLINADFINYRAETYGKIEKGERDRLLRQQLDSMGKVTLRKYFFHNNGDCSFSDRSLLSGIDEKAISNGAAYVDLDNDGDLDLVVNNIDQEASVYINNSRGVEGSRGTGGGRGAGGGRGSGGGHGADTANHFLNFVLRGDSLNRNGFGAKVMLWRKGNVQSLEQSPVRGYASSVDTRLHFGLGKGGRADSVKVIWANGRVQRIEGVPMDTTLVLDEREAVVEGASVRPGASGDRGSGVSGNRSSAGDRGSGALLVDVTDSLRVDFKHQETFFNDFAFDALLPQKYSQLGPFISTGDINGDGLTDFFVGGAFNQPGEVWLQQKNGGFLGKKLIDGLKHDEDMQSVFVDVDGDHDLDLIVAGGSSEFDKGSRFLTPRLYLNDGKGNFSLIPGAFPAEVNTIAQSISCTGGGTAASGSRGGMTGASGRAAPLRVFIGGRVSQDYPESPKSFLLEYRNGAFVDITQEVCPALADVGMVTSAVWADLDGDGQDELIVAGDWMPIRVFRWAGGAAGARLQEITDSMGFGQDRGMWRSLAVADVDGDGDPDIIAGNLGCNNPYNVSAEAPMSLYAKDFEGNGRIDPLLCYYLPDETGKKTLELGMNLGMLTRRMPSFKKRYLKNDDFARASIGELLPDDLLKDAMHLTCNELHSCWFENLGHGKFRKHMLPVEAQFAPVNAILAGDLDGDGKMDLLLGGNEYQAEVMTGRYDASYGLVLRGTGNGHFQALSRVSDGVFIKGDVKDIKRIKNGKGNDLILVGINDERLRIFTRKK